MSYMTYMVKKSEPSAEPWHHLPFPGNKIARNDMIACLPHQPQIEGEIVNGSNLHCQ